VTAGCRIRQFPVSTNSIAVSRRSVRSHPKSQAKLSELRINDPSDACGTIQDFISLVNAQTGKKLISTAQGANLITDAKQIRAVVGCPNLPRGRSVTGRKSIRNSGNTATACEEMTDFINLTKAQKGQTIPGAVTDELIAAATGIKAVLGCRYQAR
jgi:hypothetical protein